MIISRAIYRILKRFNDIAISFICIFLLTPLLIIISILIIIDTRKIPFFTQYRVGKNGKEFKIYKFRTIIESNDNKHVISWFGDFLRKTSIDELPQLINVIRNEMSIIGPRPMLFKDYDLTYNNLLFLKIKPGITGLAQVNGRKNLTYNEKVYFNNLYFQSNSLLLDCRILFKTLIIVFLDTYNFFNL